MRGRRSVVFMKIVNIQYLNKSSLGFICKNYDPENKSLESNPLKAKGVMVLTVQVFEPRSTKEMYAYLFPLVAR